MHELSITESILNIASKHAATHGARRVTNLYLKIGQLSSIVDDSVQFYWDMISTGTICAGATLHFERVPAILECLECGRPYPIQQELTPCPECGSTRVKTIAGDEFQLESIEIEEQKE